MRYYVSADNLAAFEDFKIILKKYKRIYNFSLFIDLILILQSFLFFLGYVLENITMLIITLFLIIKLSLRVISNNEKTNIISIGIIAISSIILLSDKSLNMSFLEFFIVFGGIYIISIYLNIRLIYAEKVKTVLKNIYGYAHFNEQIILDEMKDDDIYNLVIGDIATALNHKLIKKEISLNNTSLLTKISRVSNAVIIIIFLVGLISSVYGSSLQNKINSAVDFSPENMKENAYIKGKIDNVILCAGGGSDYRYWILFDGKYVSVTVPKKLNEPFGLWVEENSVYDVPINFIGKVTAYDSIIANTAVFEKQLPNEINAEEKVNNKFAIKILTGEEYKIYMKISDISGYIINSYVLLLLIVIITVKIFVKK